jgi:hypothetical protein
LYNPIFVGGVVTIYNGSTVLGSHTITANDAGYWYIFEGTYFPSQYAGNISATMTYNGTTYAMPQMVSLSTSNITRYQSPLVLDLNGDGVHTVDTSAGVVFDVLGTGSKQVTSWVDRHDGLLAIDLNGDGQINNGTELFGSGTQLANGNKAADGWQALKQHDTNWDGHINAADAVFSQLRVWVDANGDGVSDAGELRTMEDVGIVDINLAADDAMVEQNGNVLRGFSSYTTKDGATHEVVDAWLLPAPTNEQMAVNPVAPNTVEFLGNHMNLDLSAVLAAHSEATAVDMTGTGANTLKLNLADVLSLPTTNGVHQLTLTGDANDTVDLDIASWTNTGTTVTENGHSYAVYNATHFTAAQLLIDQQMLMTQVI